MEAVAWRRLWVDVEVSEELRHGNSQTPSNQHSAPEAVPGPALVTRTQHRQAPLVVWEEEVLEAMSRGIARSEDPQTRS